MRSPSAVCIAKQTAKGLKRSEDVVETALEKLLSVQELLNPVTELLADEALERAAFLDRRVLAGERPGLLQGVPICIKDMTPSKGHRTSLGSWTTGKALTDHNAVIVDRLLAAGAVIVAKTTTAEFASSSFTTTKRYGPTRNPWNRERTSGGSSGGSAVAVAVGAVPLAEGSDMGGSIRIPAACCGVVGFKPSLGRIPMDILPSAFETYSHFGPLASCVDDAAAFVAVTAGWHPRDMLSQTHSFDVMKAGAASLEGRRFALSMDLGYCDVHPQVEQLINEAIDRLREEGAIVTAVDLPWTRDVFDQWTTRWNCLLAHFFDEDAPLDTAQMDLDLIACIQAGRATSAMQLMRVDIKRKQMNEQLNAIFADHEALLCPTNAVVAPPVTARDGDYEATLPNGKLQAFDMTHPFNMVPSSPALSLPVGLSGDALPVGLQIIGPPFADEATLSLAASIEAALPKMQAPQSPYQ